jgi:hypothetical protein
MAIDPYSLCPGGTGKKLKFCCSDLLHELNKIDHMLDAEQRQACVDYITQLEAKYPDRACLLTTKALVLRELEQDEEALGAADRVLQTQPDNSVALATRAMVLMEGDDPTLALQPLHQALVACGRQVPQRVYEAVGLVAEALLAEGYVMAALAHLTWQIHVKSDYEPALMVAYRIQTAPAVPLLFKDIRLSFDPAPAGVAYEAEFQAAVTEAHEGHWLKAAERFDALMFRAAGCAALWRNLGQLRAYLANEAGAADALRRYASLDVPLDDAVEAEMLAQLLDPKNTEATNDQIRFVYQPSDVDAATAHLEASDAAMREPLEGLQLTDPDEPPPRAMFSLLDRPMPKSGSDLTEDAMPELIGVALLFGRQTDREPRLELLCDRPTVEQAKRRLGEIVGETLGHPISEEIVGQFPVPQFAIARSWRVPPDTLPARITALGIARRRKYLLHEWPAEANPVLGGRTPLQAASDRASRVAVLASIALWELNYGDAVDFNELRGRLELPLAEAIDPAATDLNALPLARLHRVEVKKLSDEQLAALWRRAVLFRARLAGFRMAGEVIARPGMSPGDAAQAHGMLAGFVDDVGQALTHLGEARRLAKTAGISCASWDLEEMAVRLSHGQAAGFVELVQHINSAHRNEPDVQQRLFQFLYEAGLVDEQGRPARAPSRQAPELVVPGGEAAAVGKIWTPGGEAGGDAGESKKSALWVPGS